MRIVVACLLATVGVGVTATTGATQSLARGDSLLATGDTSGAIAAFESLLKRDMRNAEAHYRAGVLYLSRHPAGEELSPNRRKAEEHFRYATRFQPDSAKHWIALSDAFRSEDMVTARIQVAGLVKRAWEAAAASGDRAGMVGAAYRQARTSWVSYGTFGRRYQLGVAMGKPTGQGDASPRVGPPPPLPRGETWKDELQRYTERLVPVPGAGLEYLDATEGNLRTVLTHAPLHLDAAGLLVVTLGERSRWEEAASLTRRLVRSAPDSARAWALHGLTMTRNRRWREARAAFDSAFARMTDEQRAPFRDLGQIMRAADRIRLEQMGPAQRPTFDSLYWQVAQPLTLSETNEIQAEFYARIVYADHHWSDPWRGYRGVETDPGVVFVSYGPPDIWATSGGGTSVGTTWLYRVPQFVFSFYQMSGFSRAHFGDQSEWALAQAKILAPARFDNVPVVRTLDTVLVQTARFRATGDSLALMVVGAIPLRRMTDAVAVRGLPLRTGALLTDDAGAVVTRDRADEAVTGTEARELQYRSWRVTVPPGDFTLRVEAYLPTLDRGARGTEGLNVTPFGGSELALSDLLVAQRVAPRDSAARRWTDFLVEPNAGRFDPGEPVGLLWEMYNLTPDSTGTARYEVGLWVTVIALDRTESRFFGSRALAEIVGGVGDAIGLTALYEDRVSIGYEQSREAVPGAARAEHLMVELRDAPNGRYLIEIIVRDLVTGREATTSRTITIGADPVRRGGF
jgi:GWxTD domain-containing protein